MDKETIAIDGPAASGKTTVGRLLATELGYVLLDTGIMYRAVAVAAHQQQIELSDEAAIGALSRAIQLTITTPTTAEEDGRLYTVRLDGNDVTWELRTNEVNRSVSVVASYHAVREEMVDRQRKIGQQGNVVMVGRDIGTVVMPDAAIKLYLTATAEERAKRRYDEKIKRGDVADYQTLLNDILDRDRLDSNRDHSPLLPAIDAIQIDSTDETADNIVQMVLAHRATLLNQ